MALGLARAAVDELVGFASAKTPEGGRRTLAQRPAAQAEVARAEAALRAARAFFYEAADATWAEATRAGRASVERRRA